MNERLQHISDRLMYKYVDMNHLKIGQFHKKKVWFSINILSIQDTLVKIQHVLGNIKIL